MKYFICILLLFSVTSVEAGWHWKQYNNYYLRVNDYGENDGWYYNYNCGKYYYDHKYTTNVNLTGNVDIKYSQTWKEDVVKALDRKQDNNQFQQVLRESGLYEPNTNVNAAGNYAMNLQGIQTLTQGTFGQGSTAFGAFSFQRQPVDWKSYYQYAQNFQNRASDGIQAMNNGVNIDTQLANDGDVELAKQQTSIQGIIAAQTSVTPKQVTTQLNITNGRVDNDRPPGAPIAPKDPLDLGASPLSLTRGEVGLNKTCAKCHSGDNPKGKVAFVSLWNQYSSEEKDNLACEALKRMTSHDPKYMMPPPEVNVKLSSEDRIGIYDWMMSN